MVPEKHRRGARAVDELALPEPSDHAPTEDFGHVLKVSKGYMAESSLCVEAAFQYDPVHMEMKAQEFA